MNRNPVVSIIINNFNYGRFLGAAVTSALGQTYPYTEVIVVDDGSSDDSRDIILGYGSRVVSVLKENEGQASAFNAGFARSSGDVVIFLDSDDILLPKTAELVTKRFTANPKIAKLQYRLEVIDAAGKPTGIIKPPRHVPLPSGDLHRQALAFPFDLVWLATSGNAFSARVLRRLSPVPEDLYGAIGADWYLSHLSLLCGPVDSLQEVGAYYRIHDSNLYEIASSRINLRQVRQSVVFMEKTSECLRRFAEQYGITGRQSRGRGPLSVSYVANRMISLKLDRARHPIEGDSIWKLLPLGLSASLGRFDASWQMKGIYALWFVAMALAQGPLAARLAEMLLFPYSNGLAGRLLQSLRGRGGVWGKRTPRAGRSARPAMQRAMGRSR
jgi:hypothetical protein